MIQQQVEEIRFENVIIEKLKKAVLKNGNMINWLHLLKAYEENAMFQEKDKAIIEMHRKFILKEKFWNQEITRKLDSKKLNRADIDFMFMAFDDGLYENSANLVYKRLVEEAVRKQGIQKQLSLHFITAKIEKLIEIFHHEVNYFPGLRKIYLEKKDTRKVREVFLREIAEAYDDFDVTYEEYMCWEPDEEIKTKNKDLYENSKAEWENKVNNNLNIHETLLKFQQQSFFDSVGFLSVIDLLKTEQEKLWYLRRVCLNKHELVCEYLEKLEILNISDEELIIETYKNMINFNPESEMAYLRFLVRRLNKQIYEDVTEEYNTTWGQKVTFFREEIKALIEKKRLTPKTEQSIRDTYYNYWVDVETALIRCKQSVCQIYESYLKFNPSVHVYNKYSRSMIQLGYYKDAKQILKRSCQAFKFDYQAYKEYESYLAIWGSLKDHIQFRKMKKEDKLKSESGENNQIGNEKQIEEINKQIEEKENLQNFSAQSKKIQENGKQSEQLKEDEQNNDEIDKNKRPRQFKNEGEVLEESGPKKRAYTDSGKTIFLKGIHQDWDEEKVKQLIKYKENVKEVRFVYKNEKKQNYCYVEMDEEETVDKQCQENEHKQQIYIAKSRPSESDGEERCVFLCGLPKTATQEKIKEILKDFQSSIISIRLKIEEDKAYAYIQMPSKQIRNQVILAFKGKKTAMDKKIITIKQSHSSKAETKREMKSVILKNLSFKATEDDIREFFKNLSVQEVIIPKNDQGKVRGFAFVKLKEQGQLQKALQMKSGNIKGRDFLIEKSQREVYKYNSGAKKQQEKSNSYFSSLFK